MELLKLLESMRSGELALRAQNPRVDQKLTGWLDLTLIIRQNLVNPEPIEQAVSSWKGRHPRHILTEEQALDLWLLAAVPCSRCARRTRRRCSRHLFTHDLALALDLEARVLLVVFRHISADTACA